ncbi:glutathione S-transferase [Nannochloropsis gaditana CCMP526]|uniref:glutathione S-transferase n=1 Tax=Nannochloropsis gaditana (strain CCMP526) TaxID=1093141 RepID=UPI00029F50EF|nr:glutathione S-transferase [Nannochloropsis gaditana CCMP526]EKU22039.1 glutathione S-transferase [Nannochloropsis gaditana CCMP526]|eukprot:XP_005854315.1 glutathione S-transferase [Nannochloropsis gaditana CCMP526]
MSKNENNHTVLFAVAATAATAGALAGPLSSMVHRAYKRHRHRKHTHFTLGSWRAREYGQAVRYLLAYLELPWKDRFFDMGPGPDYHQLAWVDAKDEAAHDKAVVPFSAQGLTTYLVVEERGWCQMGREGKRKGVKHARTIMRYLGRQYGLIGRNVKEMEAVDLLLDELQDFTLALHRLVHNPSYAREKERFFTTALASRLGGFEDWLLNEKKTHKKSSPTGMTFCPKPGRSIPRRSPRTGSSKTLPIDSKHSRLSLST